MRQKKRCRTVTPRGRLAEAAEARRFRRKRPTQLRDYAAPQAVIEENQRRQGRARFIFCMLGLA
jgi:hypothetical protein